MTIDLDKLKEQAPRIVAALRQSAKAASNTLRLMAEAKSMRQGHHPPRNDLYMWPKPEETTESLAGDLIESLIAKVERVDALEAALRPFAEIGTSEVFESFAARARMNLAISNPEGRRLCFVNAECFEAARNALSPKEPE